MVNVRDGMYRKRLREIVYGDNWYEDFERVVAYWGGEDGLTIFNKLMRCGGKENKRELLFVFFDDFQGDLTKITDQLYSLYFEFFVDSRC